MVTVSLEVCVDSIEGLLASVQNGADRGRLTELFSDLSYLWTLSYHSALSFLVELCSALSVGKC